MDEFSILIILYFEIQIVSIIIDQYLFLNCLFRLNLCRKNESETTELCQKVVDEVYKCHLKNPPEIFLQMTKVTLDGIACLDPIINIDAFLALFYEINGSKCKLYTI